MKIALVFCFDYFPRVGTGGASISCVGELRKRSITARAVLTDINPNIDIWEGHKAALGDVVYLYWCSYQRTWQIRFGIWRGLAGPF